jgi:hypothetical protein
MTAGCSHIHFTQESTTADGSVMHTTEFTENQQRISSTKTVFLDGVTKGMYIRLDGWCLQYYYMSSIDNNIESVYNCMSVSYLFLAIAIYEYKL